MAQWFFNSICQSRNFFMKRISFAAFRIYNRCHVDVWSVYYIYVIIGGKVNHTSLKNPG